MKAQLAKEYIETIDRIQYGCYSEKSELHYLEGQRALLHAQLSELAGYQVTVADALNIKYGG